MKKSFGIKKAAGLADADEKNKWEQGCRIINIYLSIFYMSLIHLLESRLK
jgi:hypothetical protein